MFNPASDPKVTDTAVPFPRQIDLSLKSFGADVKNEWISAFMLHFLPGLEDFSHD